MNYYSRDVYEVYHALKNKCELLSRKNDVVTFVSKQLITCEEHLLPKKRTYSSEGELEIECNYREEHFYEPAIETVNLTKFLSRVCYDRITPSANNRKLVCVWFRKFATHTVDFYNCVYTLGEDLGDAHFGGWFVSDKAGKFRPYHRSVVEVY